MKMAPNFIAPHFQVRELTILCLPTGLWSPRPPREQSLCK
jgi:hypothetical protein